MPGAGAIPNGVRHLISHSIRKFKLDCICHLVSHGLSELDCIRHCDGDELCNRYRYRDEQPGPGGQ